MSTETSKNVLFCSNANTFICPYLSATANSLDKVKRSLLLLGNMAAKMSVNRPAERKMTERHLIRTLRIKAAG